MHPGDYTVRLTVGGDVRERRLTVAMDPRVEISDDDLRLQTDASVRAYRAYERAQELRDTIDNFVARARLVSGAYESIMALRGLGEPSEPDIVYGSISATPGDRETVVGLQQKLLFVQYLLQSADARPTRQALDALQSLEATAETLSRRWATIRR